MLVSLAGGDKHGYAVMSDIRELSRIRVGSGSTYGALHHLELEGLIEVADATSTRRCYRLTERGAGTLAARVAVLNRLVTLARGRVSDYASAAAGTGGVIDAVA